VAILKRVSNKQGNGAGRALYALKHAVAVRTDIPSPLIFLLSGELSPELRRKLAREYNRHLLIHQGSSKTQHFVVSFGHHLTEKQIEKVLDRLENLFSDPYRYHLFVVHQEEHGTAVHIIESADPAGRLRHLSRKEFFDLKRAVIRELRPFLNEREREVARNFIRDKITEDWKHLVELKAPERSFKEYIRQTVREASVLIKSGELRKAVELLKSRNVEIREYKAGELSPAGKPLKRDRLYAVLEHPSGGLIAVRLDKKMRATFQQYLKAYKEYENGLEQASWRIRELRSAIGSLKGGAPGIRGEKRELEARSFYPGGAEEVAGRHSESRAESEWEFDFLYEILRDSRQESGETRERRETSEELPTGSTGLDDEQMDIPAGSTPTGNNSGNDFPHSDRLPSRPASSDTVSPGHLPATYTEIEILEQVPLQELYEPPKDLQVHEVLRECWWFLMEIPELYYLRYRENGKEATGLATRTITGEWVVLDRESSSCEISLWLRKSSKIVVVEKLTDAIALNLYRNQGIFVYSSYLILNGMENLDKAVDWLKENKSKYKHLYVALSLDEEGIEGRKKLKRELPQAKQIYFAGKDLRETLYNWKLRRQFSPVCEDAVENPYELQRYLEKGLDKNVLRELSPKLYELYKKHFQSQKHKKMP
jgi:5S rRNA maturation endonuclease (ribonuclease M5)